jgi:hypothetical protein
VNGVEARRASENGYEVDVIIDPDHWRVRIRDPEGSAVAERECRDAGEARSYASTVRQHIYWLSAPKFREYYRLPEPG